MRIISGKFKGLKLFLPQNKNTRPLKDIVKQAIFNIIKHSNKFNFDLNQKSILDLFSGTGSFGLECLSQGAAHVTFVEKNIDAIKILMNNIKRTKSDQKSLVLNESIFDFINNYQNKKFDLIFLDPPFMEDGISKIINDMKNKTFVKKNSIFIIHRHKKTKDIFSKNFNILDEKIYGLSKIIFGN